MYQSQKERTEMRWELFFLVHMHHQSFKDPIPIRICTKFLLWPLLKINFLWPKKEGFDRRTLFLCMIWIIYSRRSLKEIISLLFLILLDQEFCYCELWEMWYGYPSFAKKYSWGSSQTVLFSSSQTVLFSHWSSSSFFSILARGIFPIVVRSKYIW